VVTRTRRALTVIELAGTFAVLAIVVAISFVGLRSFVSYQDDQQAKSYLATVANLERRYASMNDGYTSNPTDLQGIPSGITVTSSLSTDRGVVSIAVGSSGSLGLATLATSGVCYTLRVAPISGSLAGAEELSSSLGSSSACDGRSALPSGEWAVAAGAPSDSPMYLLSSAYTSLSQTLTNQGTRGSTLDAQLGSASTVDANDPLWLPYTGEIYTYLPGVAGNGLSAADSAATSPSGSFEIRARIAPTTWTPASPQTIASKWATGGQRSYRFVLSYSGALQLVVSSDGVSSTSTATSTSAVSFQAGQTGWVRVVYTASSGTYQAAFYQSADGATWTALNSPASTSVTTSAVFDSTAATRVGGADDPSLGLLQGNVYQVTFATTSGVPWLDLSTSTCNQTACLGTTGTSWSVLRATAPLAQTAVVDRTMFLVTNTSWLQIPANSNLDIPASQSYTVVIAGRWHGGASAGTPQVVSHRDQVSSSPCGTGGWSIHQTTGSTPTFQSVFANGTTCTTAALSLTDHRSGVLGAVRSTGGGTLASFAGSTLNEIATKAGTTTGLSASAFQSSYPLRVGLLASGSGVAQDQPGSFEFFGLAVYQRALSDDEIIAVGRLLGM
jgi:Tfp pilus assembly protein PilE